MVSLFYTEDELYFSIEIPQIFVEHYNQTRQFNSMLSEITLLAQFPTRIFLTRCAHYSDILTPK